MLLTEIEKRKFAEENYSLIFYVVKMFQTTGISYDELVSIAMVGYAKALNSFDKKRNVKFSTYAINCIKNEILFFLRKEKNYMRNTVSMATILSTDKNGNDLLVEDTVSRERNKGELLLEEDVILNDDIEMLKEAMKYLSEKERYIITYRYGLDRGIIKTQKEIADAVGMSQANVSKIEKNILEKIKKILREKFNMEGAQYL